MTFDTDLLTPGQAELVVLTDPNGTPIGQQRKGDVHGPDTPLHLAFSLYLFDDDGRVLMTRRSLAKQTWPGVWTNSCCGHPGPGEQMEHAIERRLGVELGCGVSEVRAVLPRFRYRAQDASGIWENEICPVFVGRLAAGSVLLPNAQEVCEWAWVEPTDLVAGVTATPFAFSPWATEQVNQMAGLPSGFHADMESTS